MEKTKILIDIDSLFDTRQARLIKLVKDEVKVANYIASRDYNFRRYDDFSQLVDMEEYRKIPSNIELLKKSTISFIFFVLKEKILSLDVRNSFLSINQRHEVLINFHGYSLSDDDMYLICEAIYVKLGLNTKISPVSINPVDINPKYLKNSDYAYIFIYDYHEWLDNMLIYLMNGSVENVVFYLPSLYIGSKEDIEEKEDIIKKRGFNNLFNFLEFIVSEKIKIRFVPIFFYTNAIISSKMAKQLNEYFSKIPLKED